MRTDRTPAMDRRQWLRHVLRTVILSGLAWLSWTLAGRARRGTCVQPRLTCRDCSLLTTCGYPKTQTDRRDREMSRHTEPAENGRSSER